MMAKQKEIENHQSFEENLKKLLPVLERLNDKMKKRGNGSIVWLNQYPSLDYVIKVGAEAPTSLIDMEKIHHYNSIVRHILK